MNRLAFVVVMLWLIQPVLLTAAGHELVNASGRELMQTSFDRHEQYPYVYEEQTMVLIDRQGNRETRKLRRFSRVEPDGLHRLLLLFDSPDEVKGVAVLAERSPDGATRQSVYLPAYGKTMIRNGGEAADGNFLGTDFSIENLSGENLDDYDYRRQRDVVVDDVPYFIVDVYDRKDEETTLARLMRRHFIRQDNVYITRTDHFDNLGRLRKRQSHHDLTPVLGSMWRANMLFMEDQRARHSTLIKINRRVFSADYVPVEVFTPDWLYKNRGKSSESEDADDAADEVNSL